MIAYFDCSSGISGDMCLGALIDAGVPVRNIEDGLKRLPIRGYQLVARRVKRAGIRATKADVVVTGRGADHVHRTWKDIKEIVEQSSLPTGIKRKGLAIARRLFVAEGKVHRKAFTRTHLHELGAIDCLVDIFGTLIGLDFLGVDSVYASAINLGSGTVKTEHGILPVPAPATAEILNDLPVYVSSIPFELTTPTGAAILKEIADGCLGVPVMIMKTAGYGAGQKEIAGMPNALRILLGEAVSADMAQLSSKVTVVETNIDDMSPQIYEYVMERLFGAGALDVYLTQVIMKKGRPGVILSVLCDEDKKSDVVDILFQETTTIGVRFYETSRIVLERKVEKRATEFGSVRVKISGLRGKAFTASPEYEDCKRIAQKHKVPLRDVLHRLSGEKSLRNKD